MKGYISNSDKILQAVLLNARLMELGGYASDECFSLEKALASENVYVHTVAEIIDSHMRGDSDASIYRAVAEYLKENL